MGVIYILTNPSFPEYIKIGYADNLTERLKQLNRSETIPYSFRAYATYEVQNRLTDKEVHNLIDKINPELRSVETFNGKERVKEFFAMSAEDAYSILESIAKISGTEERLNKVSPTGTQIREAQQAEEIAINSKRSRFRFSELGIKPGEKIYFLKRPDIFATAIDDTKIEYKGQTASLSASAQNIMGWSYQRQGPAYWTYQGKTLADLRDEITSNNNKGTR